MLFITFFILLFLDQWTKYLAQLHLKNKGIVWKKNCFTLEYLENQGAFLGILKHKKYIIYILSFFSAILLFILMIYDLDNLWNRVFETIFFAGLCGNLFNRIRHGYVIDFIGVKFEKKRIIFNLADVYLFIASICLISAEILGG